MKRAFLDALATQREVILQLWRDTLHQAPVNTALANPDILMFKMDDTLNELFSMGRSRSLPAWLAEHPPSTPLIDKACCCGLNPLLAYFLAGESAMTATVRRLKAGPDLSETEILKCLGQLVFALHVLGHREINSFCEICLIESPSTAARRAGANVPALCPYKASTRFPPPPPGEAGKL